MVNELLVSLVNKVLRETGKSTARGNLAYHCPKCTHSKLKLEINFDTSSPHYGNFGCWVCGFKSKNLLTLFKFLEVDLDIFQEARSLYKKNNSNAQYKPTQTLKLPDEFLSILDNKNIWAKHALSYLKSRGITESDILKYGLGYCEKGHYSRMIIIPSYDENGNLNFFTARSFDKNSPIKYKNPEYSRDIIPFELFINWNLPVILCEGPFDALSIKRNAIPLLGKNIQPNLMKKLVSSAVKKIYIALDSDAIKQSLKFCEQLMDEGKEVYLVDLEDKDPGEMNFKNFTKLIQTITPLNSYKLMEKKLSIL
jgi:DNA primase